MTPLRGRKPPSRSERTAAAPLIAAVLLVLLPAGALAQEGEAGGASGQEGETAGASARDETGGVSWLGGDRLFPAVLADPREPITRASLIRTDLFSLANGSPERPPFQPREADPYGRELQADVSFGGHLPLLKLEPWSDGALLVGVEGAIFGRFRLEPTQNDLVGSDWVVALPVEASRGDLSGRFRVRHWSAHLGDEMAEESGARRISYGIDVVDLQGAWALRDGARAYVGGSLPLRSTTEIITDSGSEDRDGGGRVHAGVESRWWPFGSDGLGVVTALDWEAGSITEWQGRAAMAAGLEYHRDGRGLRLMARGFDGPSPVGQFFGSREQYWGLEVQADW